MLASEFRRNSATNAVSSVSQLEAWIAEVRTLVDEALSSKESATCFVKSVLGQQFEALLKSLQASSLQICQDGDGDRPSATTVSRFVLSTVASLRLRITAVGSLLYEERSTELVAEDDEELEQLLEEVVRQSHDPQSVMPC